jgi:hypothetical protein
MPDRPWDQQLKDFLKRTGDDLKKAGEEIRAEAQKLIAEVRDPDTQQKIKDGLGNLGQWAKKSAEDVLDPGRQPWRRRRRQLGRQEGEEDHHQAQEVGDGQEEGQDPRQVTSAGGAGVLGPTASPPPLP